MFCRCWKVTPFNPNSTFSTNWAQKQVTAVYSLHDDCHLKFSFYNNFKLTSNQHLFNILNFFFFSPPIFSPTLKQNTSTLGNGFREKKNSVSSPVQRKNGGTCDRFIISSFPWPCCSKPRWKSVSYFLLLLSWILT